MSTPLSVQTASDHCVAMSRSRLTPRDVSDCPLRVNPAPVLWRDPYKPVHELPDDAVVVTPPHDKPIEDRDSETKNLMAPSRADYRQVYAAGRAIASLPLLSQVPAIRAAVAQGGAYDFQRDPTKGFFYGSYTNPATTQSAFSCQELGTPLPRPKLLRKHTPYSIRVITVPGKRCIG
jgi:hypothetical protein